LKAFVGAGQGHVTTWYDQMGGTAFTQTTAARQPVIVQGGNVQYIGSTPAIRYNVLAMHLNNASMNFSAGQRRDITVKYKIDTLSNFQGVISANGINYRQAITATAQVFFDGTQRTYTPTFTFTDPVTLRIDSNNATINNSSVSANFAVPNITTGFAIGGWGALETMKGSMTEVSVGPFNFDTTITTITGNAYVNDTTITGYAKVRLLQNESFSNLFPIGADSAGILFKAPAWGVPSDSLAWRRAGITQPINTIGWMNTYNGTVGASAAGNAVDSANLIWGARAGQALTTGYRNIAIGRGAMKSTTTGHTNIAIGDSAMALGNVLSSGNIAIGQRALSAYIGGGGGTPSPNNSVAIGTNAASSFLGTSSNTNLIAIGFNACAACSTGQAVAIGPGVLQNHPTGNFNVGIGNTVMTGTGILAGSEYNTGIGQNILNNLTNGIYNIGIGFNALSALTTGQFNVHIVADGTGGTITTGRSNVVIGNRGNGITTTNEHTVVGALTRTFTNVAGGATIFGSDAGNNFTHGSRVTIMGYRSGRTLGDDVTVMGFRALNTGSVVQDEDSSVAIGSFAGSAIDGGTPPLMNRNAGIYIGYQAAASGLTDGSTYTGNELIAIGVRAAVLQKSGDYNMALGRVNLANTTGSNQLAIGGNGIGWIRQDVDGSLRRTLLNTTTSDVTTFTPSTALEINGTNGAVLLPRLTTAQRDALTPTNGMILYNTTTDKIQAYAGGAWVDLH
jgi:hypothetical protein